MTAGIGELNERSLHRALKARYAAAAGGAPPTGAAGELEVRDGALAPRLEHPIDGFVADVLIGERIIEVHTGTFATLRRKLPKLLERFQVTLVYPVARDRYIVKVPAHPDAPTTRRKSPKHDSVFLVFTALVSIPKLLQHPNLTLDVVMTVEEVVRAVVGRSGRRWRRDWVSVDRRLLEVVETHTVTEMGDLFALLDADLPIEFTTQQLAAAMRSSRRLGQQAAFCFREAGVTEICGKEGNALLYRRCQRPRRASAKASGAP